MTNMIDVISEGWGMAPVSVVNAPAMIRGTQSGPLLSAAFWHIDKGASHTVTATPQPDFAILAFHLDHSFNMELQVDRTDIFRGTTGPGDFCLIPPGHDPEASVTGAASVVHLYLPTPLYRQVVPDQIATEPMFGQSPKMNKPVAELVKWRNNLTGDDDQSAMIAYGALLQMTGLLSRALAPQDTGERLTQPMVKRADAMMQSHLGDPLKVADMAAALDMSEAHFARAYRNTTGKTPGEALRALRMDHARDRLKDPSANLIDVAAEVGYSDPSSFAKLFRATYGMTPSAWRAKLRRQLPMIRQP
ncbi:MAG: AraC family transcriptional regulator [Pseudomonadota bacterium]